MIGHFPTPYPDELLYSLCARYSARVQYSSSTAVNSELFGTSLAMASVDITCNLKYLIDNLPPMHSHTVGSLIDNHTLLPVYNPFLPQERVARVRKLLEYSNGSAVRGCLGLILTTIVPPAWLRFCPLCAEDERKRYGECYWHRLHQATGVEVCPIHCTFLEASCLPTRNPYTPYSYISASQVVVATPPRQLDLTDQSHRTLIDLTNDVVWLLGQKNLVVGYNSLHAGFSRLLTESGLTTYAVNKRRNKLLEKFRSLYSTEILRILQCDFDDKKRHAWLYRIVNDLNILKAHHPLRYLLLIRLLGHTVESFLSMCLKHPPKISNGDKPFGDGPWPCLNPVCKHFRKPHIPKYLLSFTKKPYAPLGIFKCSCGFIYSRRGPDISNEDRYRASAVRAYGSLWESHLRRYWNDSTLAVRQIGVRLGVKHSTIKFHATRLGLQFPRLGPTNKSVLINLHVARRLKKAHAGEAEKRKHFRKLLLLALKKHPTTTRTTLRTKLLPPRVYEWLVHHDLGWLEPHLPSPSRTGRPIYVVDMSGEDLKLSMEVRQSAAKLKNISGKPIRITKTIIGKDLNKVRILCSNAILAKLPLTATALIESLETRVEFAIRRINWATDCFRQENTSPTWAAIPFRATLGRDIWHVAEVEEAIDAALLSLQQPNANIATEAA